MESRELPAGDKRIAVLVEKRVDGYLRRQEGRLLKRVQLGPRAVGWKIAE